MKPIVPIFLVLVLAAMPMFAQDISKISVVTEEWEDATNADGSGLYFEILRAVYEASGSSLDIQIMPYSRAVDTVVRRQADLVIGTYIDEVEGVVYPKWHFDSDIVSALYLKQRFPAFKGESDLAGKRVAWMRGYGYNDYIEVPMTMTEVDKRETALALLGRSRADFFLDAAADIDTMLADLPPAEAAKYAVQPIKYLRLFMSFADTPKGRKLAATWDRSFDALLKKGTIKALFEEWEFMDSYRF